MSVVDLDLLFMSVCSLSLEQFKDGKVSVADDSYKIKVNIKKDTGDVSFNIMLTKIDDSSTCVEFHKKEGTVTNFYSIIDEFKKGLPTEANLSENVESKSTEATEKTEVEV